MNHNPQDGHSLRHTSTVGSQALFAAALFATGAAALAAAVAGNPVGPSVRFLPVPIRIAAPMTRRADLAVGLLLGLVILAESDPDSFIATSWLFEPSLPGLRPFDAAFIGVTAAVALDCVRRREAPRLPRPIPFALMLLVAAMGMGSVTGHFGGGTSQQIYATALVLGYLVVTPLLVAAVLRTPAQVRVALGVAAILIGLKALAGVAAVLAGAATIEVTEGTPITYYEPTTNWLIVLTLVTVAAGWIRHARLPRWIVYMWPLLLVALVMSYRRSFWLIAILAICFVAVLGATTLQRRLAVPVALVIAGGVVAALSSGFAAGVQGPVVERAESLTPSQITASASDRYRITERRNVIEDLERHPVVGLGIGVAWTARLPVVIDSAEARQYTHVAILWYWMKLGALGPFAYVLLMLGTAAAAFRVFRLHPEPWISVVGLGSAAGLLGLMAGELTATFSGADPRFTVALGAQIGLVSVLHRQAVAARGSRPTVALRAGGRPAEPIMERATAPD